MTTAEAQAHGHDRNAINQLGIWLFFLSETFLFGGLIAVRYYLQGFQRPDSLNQPLGLAITAVLLASSLTAYHAETAAAHGDQRRFARNLSATIFLGVLFLAGVGVEWYEAFQHFPPSTGFGTVFFTMTRIHATHVLTGVIALVVVWFLGRRPGRFTAESHWGVEGTVKYWHFVDVAWVFIYPPLYLVS